MRHDLRFLVGAAGALGVSLIVAAKPLAAEDARRVVIDAAAQCPAAQSWRDFSGTSWTGDQIVNVIVIHEDGRISWNGGRTNEATLDRLAYLIASSDDQAITALVNRAPNCAQAQKVQEIFARHGCVDETCIVAPNLMRGSVIPLAGPA